MSDISPPKLVKRPTLKGQVEELTTCSICLDDYVKPRSLPCLHTFCLQCLHDQFGGRSPDDPVPCPMCRKGFAVPPEGFDALPHNFLLECLVEAKRLPVDEDSGKENKAEEKATCEVCFDADAESGKETATTAATVYCVQCQQKLCQRCSLPHRKFKDGSHDIQPLEKLATEKMRQPMADQTRPRRVYCDKHGEEPLKLYCFDCQTNVCLICSAVQHPKHRFEEISEVAKEVVEHVDKSASKISARIDEINAESKQLDEEMSRFLSAGDEIDAGVRRRGEELKRLIDVNVERLLDELEKLRTAASKEVAERKERQELAATALSNFGVYWAEMKVRARPSDLTRVRGELHSKVEDLLTNYGTSGDVYRAPSVTFVQTSDNEFVNNGVNPVGVIETENVQLPVATTARNNIVQSDRKTIQRQSSFNELEGRAVEVEFVDVEKTERRMSEGSSLYSLDEGDTVSMFPAAAGPPAPAVTRSSIHRVPSVSSIGTVLTGCHSIIGVALIDNELIVLRKRQKDQVEFYDIEDNKLLRQRSIGGLNTDWWYNDLASCVHNQCLYISDFYNCCIHRITLEGAADRWTVVDKPRNLSVTAEHNLLITSRAASKLTEFTNAGEFQRQVSLQSLPARPWHAVKLQMSDQFVVSYGFRGRAAQCYVSIVNADGQVVHTYSGGQSNARLNEPYHVAVDCDGFIYVADYRNHRILMLSRTLDYVGHVVSRGLQGPYRMCLDAERRKLYVGQWNGQLTAIELLTNKS